MGMPKAKKCDVCGNVAFETILEYDLHIKSRHPGSNTLGNAYKCQYCTKFFDTCDGLEQHLSTAHS